MSSLSQGLDPKTPGAPQPAKRGVPAPNGVVLIVLVYVVMYLLYGWSEPEAFSAYAIANLSNNAAPLALAAAGQTLVVLSKGFDLSLAGVISIANVLVAVFPFEGPIGAGYSLLLCLPCSACSTVIWSPIGAYKASPPLSVP
ncbi:hypothetical protein [Martelella alba]|uniref:Uncharacterized protein n=1 Tax=Martelella alba TaxID=2590451 RepID=A0ABY2SJQ3_9HYPH|nr:hypothetical protein [Martelella alba]TKI05244.1 hypothetical protein FCN80_15290 [Martelella alba]